MGAEWQKTNLGKVLSFSNGQSSPERTNEGAYPVFGSNGLIGSSAETNAESHTIIIGRVGSYCGSLQFSKDPCWVTDNAIRATASGDNASRFFFYLLKQINLHQWRGGSGQPLLNQRTLNSISTVVPDPREQHKIADILGTLDDKVDLNRQMSCTLEAIACAIFKAWFVDFEPVNAKAAGAKSFRGMPQAVFDQLPDRFTETELGRVPEGWEIKPISVIASVSRDSVTPANTPDELFEHFSIPAFDAGKEPARDRGGSIKSNKYRVSTNCVLVSKLNPRFARVWLPDAPVNGAQQICSTEFLVLTPKEGWSREQLYCQFLEVGFRQMLEQRASGTSNSHQRIKPKDFENTKVVCSPEDVRQAFFQLVEPIFSKTANLHREGLTLAAIRDTLLPKLISGDLRVPAADGGADDS